MNIFCADIGTTSLKTAVINQKGEVLFSERKVFFDAQNKKESSFSDDKTFISSEWEKAFLTAVKDYKINCTEKSQDINAICISGNGPSLVSENGRTLLWNEKEESKKTAENKEKKDDPESRQKEKIHWEEKKSPSLYIPRLKLFKKKYEKDFKESSYIFSGPEYLVWRLTGKAATVLPEKGFLPAYWTEEELKKEGFSCQEIKKLPGFVKLGHIAGSLTAKAAEKLGLSKETKVIFGGPDFVMALIGTATVEEGKICDRSGSSEGINLCSKKPVFAEGIRTLPSVIPGLWNLSVIIEKSGSLLDSFKADIEKLSGKTFTYDELISYAYSDKNSQGYFTLKEIDGNVKEAVFTLKKIAGENNLPVDDFMTVTGGQAKNDLYLRRKALDIKTELCVLENPDAELTGDAATAFTSLGLFPDLVSAAKNLAKIKKRYGLNESFAPEMKIYSIPQKLSAIIFDIDSTLYTSEAYAIEQVDVQIRCIAQKRGISASEARNLISEYRRNWKNEHQGKKISLGNTLLHFGVSIEESIEMREKLLEPGNFLSTDYKLIKALTELSKKYRMICVTNNPILPARKTLDALGVSDFFPEIIGLDTCKKSKPAREPFELAAKKLGKDYQEILSVGDRFDMDLSLPLEMGMGAILVGGVQDVWKLPELLDQYQKNKAPMPSGGNQEP
ncbi:MAG: HAD hydrolase-like protein [Treponema sp.]|nr:HAD hydrolase-like protein [Treponema sp.]